VLLFMQCVCSCIHIHFLQVAYMDHLDINYGAGQHRLDYGIPRLHHICSTDFQIVTKLDRINSSGRHVFGALDVSFSFLLDIYFFIFLAFLRCKLLMISLFIFYFIHFLLFAFCVVLAEGLYSI
jgi:hypothetical protein